MIQDQSQTSGLALTMKRRINGLIDMSMLMKMNSRSGVRGSIGLATMAAGIVCLVAVIGHAEPQGANVVAGSAQINQNGATTTIDTQTANTIINYNQFNIAGHETVIFNQPDAQSRVLNRVQSLSPSLIEGSLLSNGMVYIVNPAGVYFGNGAYVNVGGLYAAAANLTNENFLGGVDHFQQVGGDVANHGLIESPLVNLIGRHVANHGMIIAEQGMVTMVAGDDVLLGDRQRHFMVRMEGAAGQLDDQAGVENSGEIAAEGGKVVWGAGDMYAMALRNGGAIKARQVALQAGQAGVVEAGGVIDASDAAAGQVGGTVELRGGRIAVTGTIDASGAAGGGTITVGGEAHGQGQANAQRVLVTDDAALHADALKAGDGGQVVVWSDGKTWFNGSITARGAGGGDGGFVETSGKLGLSISDALVDTSAQNGGRRGTWLLDPTDIRIVAATTDTAPNSPDILFADADDPTDGTADDLSIAVAAINGAAADVVLQAERDIFVETAVNIAAAGVNLTMQAGNDVNVTSNVTLNNAALHLEADSPHATGGADGTGVVTIGASAAIATGGGNLTMIGANYDVQSGAAIDVGNGDVTVGPSQATAALIIGTGGQFTQAEISAIANATNLNFGSATSAGTDGAGAGAVTLAADTLSIDGVDAGSANLGLTAENNLTLTTVTTTGDLAATSNSGSIVGGTSNAVTAANITFTADTGAGDAVGSFLNPISTNATTVSGAAGDGGFFITDSASVDVNSIAITGAGDVDVTAGTNLGLTNNAISTGGGAVRATAGGNLNLADNAIDAGAGNVTLTATGGNITEAATANAKVTTTGTLALNATSGVAGTKASPIDVANVTGLTINTANGFGVNATGGEALTSLNMVNTLANVDPANWSDSALTGFAAGNAAFDLTSDGTDLSIVDLTSDLNLPLTVSATTGDILIDNISLALAATTDVLAIDALTGGVTFNAGGSIDGGAGTVNIAATSGSIAANDAGPHITTTGAVDLTAAASIGDAANDIVLASAPDVAFDANNDLYVAHDGVTVLTDLGLNINPQNSGTYSLTNFNGLGLNITTDGTDTTINSVTVAAGGPAFELSMAHGDIIVDDTGGAGGIAANDADVSLEAQRGSILELNDNQTANITTTGVVTLKANTQGVASPTGSSGQGTIGGDASANANAHIDIADSTQIVLDARDHVAVRGTANQTLTRLDLTVDPAGPNVGGSPVYRIENFDNGGGSQLVPNGQVTSDGTDLTVGTIAATGATTLGFGAYTGDLSATAINTANAPITLTTHAGDLDLSGSTITTGGGAFTANATAEDDGAGFLQGLDGQAIGTGQASFGQNAVDTANGNVSVFAGGNILVDENALDAGTGDATLRSNAGIDELDSAQVVNITAVNLAIKSTGTVGNLAGESINFSQDPLLDVQANTISIETTGNNANINVKEHTVAGTQVNSLKVAFGFVRFDTAGPMTLNDNAVVVTDSNAGSGFVWLVSDSTVTELNNTAVTNITTGPQSTIRIDAEGDVAATGVPLDTDATGLWLNLGQDSFENIGSGSDAGVFVRNVRAEALDVRVLNVQGGGVEIENVNDSIVMDEFGFGFANTPDLDFTVPGASIITIGNGGWTTAAGNVTFNGDVVLSDNTTITGDVVDFTGALQSDATARSLVVNTANASNTFFRGEVGNGGTNPLSSLVTNADGQTHLFGDVYTSGGTQAYHDVLVLNTDTLLQDTGTAATAGVYLNGGVITDGTARGLTILTAVSGVGTEVPLISFGGDVGTGANPLKYLRLNTYDAGGDGLFDGTDSASDRDGRSTVPAIATVTVVPRTADNVADPTGTVGGDGTWDVSVNEDFSMGRNGKLTAKGNVNIDANLGGTLTAGGARDAVRLGDVNTTGSLAVDASNGARTVLLARAAGERLTPDDANFNGVADEFVADTGLDYYLSAGSTLTNTTLSVDKINAAHADPIFYALNTGTLTGLGGITSTSEQLSTYPEIFRTQGARVVVVDPIEVEKADLATVYNGYGDVPRLDDAIRQILAPADSLSQMQINVRQASEAERLQQVAGAATYDDVRSGAVALPRIRTQNVLDALAAYRNLFYTTATTSGGQTITVSRADHLASVLQNAFDAYRDAMGDRPITPAGFRIFVRNNEEYEAALGTLNQIRQLNYELRYLGLTGHELRATQQAMLGTITPRGMRPRHLVLSANYTP